MATKQITIMASEAKAPIFSLNILPLLQQALNISNNTQEIKASINKENIYAVQLQGESSNNALRFGSPLDEIIKKARALSEYKNSNSKIGFLQNFFKYALIAIAIILILIIMAVLVVEKYIPRGAP